MTITGLDSEQKLEEKDVEKLSEYFYEQAINKRFLEERKIFLWGTINDKTCQEIVKKILFLEMLDSTKDITLLINSPGGIITSGMAIFDVMQMAKPKISTVCMGLAASMGAMLLLAGERGRRCALPHSKILIHQPLISGQIVAPAIDIKIQAEEINKTRLELNRIIAEKTGQTLKKVEEDTDRDFYMTAPEAKEYGLIDKVLS